MQGVAEQRAKWLESRMRKQLNSLADLNYPPRSLLLRALTTASASHRSSNASVNASELVDALSLLGIDIALSDAKALLHTVGTDKMGYAPSQLLVHQVLESPSRLMGLEDRRTGAFNPGERDFHGRIKYWPCRRGVYTPSHLSNATIEKSERLPRSGLSLQFVYGYGGVNNTAPNLFYTRYGRLVYYTAAVGIVLDREKQSQYFFLGHDNDILSLTIHPGRRLVATGQQASLNGFPYICIWDSDVYEHPVTGEKALRGLVKRLPFPDSGDPPKSKRGVIAVNFSWDGRRLVGITKDDRHTVHVFDWRRGENVVKSTWPPPELISLGPGRKGEPPQVYGVVWNPFPLSKGDAEKKEWAQFVTYGVKHIKLWQCFKNSVKGDYYGGLDKPGAPEGGRFSSCYESLEPVDITSATFLPPRQEKQQLVTGTREGDMLIWSVHGGLRCKHKIHAHDRGRPIPSRRGNDEMFGGLRVLRLRDDSETILSAGADGCVREWDVHKLQSQKRNESLLREIEIPSQYADSAPPLFRSLDCMPQSEVFVAGTYRCDIFEVDGEEDPEPVMFGHSMAVYALAWCPTNSNIFVTASDNGRVHVYDADANRLRTKCNIRRSARSCCFTCDGCEIAIGCADGRVVILTYTAPSTLKQKHQSDGSRCEFRVSNEAISVVKFSPDGHYLAIGSHDTVIYVFRQNDEGSYQYLHRCVGHSSTIGDIDWEDNKQSADGNANLFHSTDHAYEFLCFDARTGRQTRENQRDTHWATYNCTLGFPVMGIWPQSGKREPALNGLDINAVDRTTKAGEEILVSAEDTGKLKLFAYPCIVYKAPFRAVKTEANGNPVSSRNEDTSTQSDCLGYLGHSAHICNARFSPDARWLCTLGGRDRAVFQWSVDEEAKPQLHVPKVRKDIDVHEIPDRKRVPKMPSKTAPNAQDEIQEKQDECQRSTQQSSLKRTQQKRKPFKEQQYANSLPQDESEGAEFDIEIHAPGERQSIPDNCIIYLSFGFTDASSWKVDVNSSDIHKENSTKSTRISSQMAKEADIQALSIFCQEPVKLDKIIATRKDTGRQYAHLMYAWLDQKKWNKHSSVLVKRGSVKSKEQEIELIVETAEENDAGTSAWIYVDVEDIKEVSSGPVPLDRDEDAFQEGSRDVFSRVIPEIVGEPNVLRISHNEVGSAWKLSKVELIAPDIGTCYSTKADSWIEAGETKEFALTSENTSCSFRVYIRTDDSHGAGIKTEDAEPKLQLIGKDTNGCLVSTEWKPLDAGFRDQFLCAMRNVVYFRTNTLSSLDEVILKLESNAYEEWKVASISVESVQEDWYVDLHPQNFWIVANEQKRLSITSEKFQDKQAFDINIRTADTRLAGTQLPVFLDIFGTNAGNVEASTGPLELENSSQNFGRGTDDRFSLKATRVDEVRCIKLIHGRESDASVDIQWKCVDVMVKNTSSGSTAFFNVDAWVRAGTYLTREPGTPKTETNEVLYKLEIKTSDLRGAGTGADIYCNIGGENGSTGTRYLECDDSKFKRGQLDTVHLQSSFLGEMNSLEIGHNDAGAFSAWHLESVTVECVDEPRADGLAKRVTFPYNRWLSSKDEPFTTSATLFPDVNNDGLGNRPEGYVQYEYTVRIYTGDERGATTTASISLELQGSQGTLGPEPLDEGKFERGEMDVFTLKGQDVGDVYRVVVRSDGCGMRPDWYCSQVEVFSSTGDGSANIFPCGKWFSSKNDKGATLERVLIEGIGEEGVDEGKRTYKLSFYTTNRFGAGTDATVSIQFKGAHGTTEQTTLNSSTSNFQRGGEDVFFLRGDSVADFGNDGQWDLEEVKLEIEDGTVSPRWHLSHFTIQDPTLNALATFRCHGWIDKKNPRRVWRKGRGVPREQALEMEGGYEDSIWYRIRAKTGDQVFAATDETITFTFLNDHEEWWTPPLPQDQDTFGRGSEEEMLVSRSEPFGQFRQLRVGPLNDKWLMNEVSVRCYEDGKEWKFLHNDWVGIEGAIVPATLTREKADGLEDQPSGSALEIKVTTENRVGAATDNEVNIQLLGTEGESEELYLGTGKDHFASGSSNYFERVLQSPIGHVGFLRVWHTGRGSKWYLQSIVVVDKASGDSRMFNFNRWISDGHVHGEAAAEVHVADVLTRKDDKPGSETQIFQFEVHTGDAIFARTSNEIPILLVDCHGQCWRVTLNHSEETAIDVGRTKIAMHKPVEFSFEEPVVLVLPGLNDQWLLQKAVLTREVDGREWTFLHNHWVKESHCIRALPTRKGSNTNEDEFNFTVCTSERAGASTGANVYLLAEGKQAESTVIPLDTGAYFEPGSELSFNRCTKPIGPLIGLKIWHDGEGTRARWHLDRVEVQHHRGEGRENYVFPCIQWLEADAIVYLTPERHVEEGNTDGSGTKMQLCLETLDEAFGNTDEPMRLTFNQQRCPPWSVGVKKALVKDEATIIELNRKIAFEDGFESLEIAPLQHDRWTAKRVTLTEHSSGSRWEFPIFTTVSDEGYTASAVQTRVGGIEQMENLQEIKVCVITGNERWSATDNWVQILLEGSPNDATTSKWTVLDRGNEAFDRNSTTDCIRVYQKAAVQNLRHLHVHHGEEGRTKAWLLDAVELKENNEEQNLLYRFPCHSWINAGDTAVLSPAHIAAGQSQAYEEYDLKLETLSGFFTGTKGSFVVNFICKSSIWSVELDAASDVDKGTVTTKRVHRSDSAAADLPSKVEIPKLQRRLWPVQIRLKKLSTNREVRFGIDSWVGGQESEWQGVVTSKGSEGDTMEEEVQLTVRTADKLGAAAADDADITAMLIGDQARSQELWLLSGGGRLDRGAAATETFVLETYVGTLQSVTLRFVRGSRKWLPAHIDVKREGTQDAVRFTPSNAEEWMHAGSVISLIQAS